MFWTEVDILLVIRPSRGRRGAGEGVHRQIVFDGWKGYLGWVLQSFWPHLLRYAKSGAEKSAEGKALYVTLCEVYPQMTQGLGTASPKTRARRITVGTEALTRLLRRYGRNRSAGVERVVTYLLNGMAGWLTLLEHPGMDATNNRGKRGLRVSVP